MAVNEDLRLEIMRLFGEDQEWLARLDATKQEVDFAEALEERVGRIAKPALFYSDRVWQLWGAEPDAPELVREYATWRKQTTDRVKEIIDEFGWPTRAIAGDDASFFFFWLFGHADAVNDWRRTQIDAIDETFRTDRFDSRLYAHVRDRIEAVSGNPQIFGTVMGPGDEPGTARHYCPLLGTDEEVDVRRAEIGLPPMEVDLEEFCSGAVIGPYMTPSRGTGWL